MNLLDQVTHHAFVLKTLTEAGVVRPIRPDKALKVLLTLQRWGPTPAAGYAVSAIRYGGETAIIDELGTLTFEEVHRRSNALAHAFREHGIKQGDNVAVLCRNHRGFVDTTIALSKLGANALYLNTQFAAPQVADVCERENPVALVYDEEFGEMVAEAGKGRERFIAWFDGPERPDCPVIEDLIAAGDDTDLTPPPEKGRVLILTSGTTGTPKSASRKQPESLDPAAALFSKIPLRARERTMIAAPLFHTWGFAHFTLGMALSSTLVLRRKFRPEEVLSDIARHRCTALIVVPVMLQRILELGDETIRRYDLSSLRVIAASGSSLPGDLAIKVMDAFGDVLYNLYGSTEVAWATIATPEDLREAPGTAGRPPRGTVVRLYDKDGKPLPEGEGGRIFVGNEMLFEGYTGGGHKDQLDGLMSSGDVGHFDAAGRLFIDGRDDEMIVSGGENVFPREVEDLLAAHPDVEEAAVIGVQDAGWGQRLAAFIVTNGGDLTADGVKQHVKANLASYKVPRDVTFLDELPRNATGKVLKRALKEQAEGSSQEG